MFCPSEETAVWIAAELNFSEALPAARMADERPDHTLQATSLVHEAYVRLVDGDNARQWKSRGHFFSAAAEAMRRILVDSARANKSQKRSGNLRRVELQDYADSNVDSPEMILDLDERLSLGCAKVALVG